MLKRGGADAQRASGEMMQVASPPDTFASLLSQSLFGLAVFVSRLHV